MSSLLQCHSIRASSYSDGFSFRLKEPHHLGRHFDSSLVIGRRSRFDSQKSIIIARGFGFELPGSEPRRGEEGKWQVGKLLNSAASVLLFRSVLTTKVTQKYLELLKAIAVRAPPERLLDAYGSFYSQLIATGNSSWQEYVVDQIFWGRDNPFARSVADGQLPADSGIRTAARYDLDALQRLAVVEQTLVDWVQDACSGPDTIPEDWAPAAVQLGPVRADAAPRRLRTPPPEFRDDDPPLGSAGVLGEPLLVTCPPPSPEQRREWMDRLASQWRWSDGLPDLELYWHLYGWGPTSRHSLLTFQNGGLSGYTSDPIAVRMARQALILEEAIRQGEWLLEVVESVRGFLAGPSSGSLTAPRDAPQQYIRNGGLKHIIEHVARALLQEFGQSSGLRIVRHVDGSPEALAKSLAAHPRTPFVVLTYELTQESALSIYKCPPGASSKITSFNLTPNVVPGRLGPPKSPTFNLNPKVVHIRLCPSQS
eukprot:jgi/Botrbrau1/21153/Bobra.0061s0047.1